MPIVDVFFSWGNTMIETFSGIVEWFETPINVLGKEYTPFWLVLGGGLTVVLGYLVVKWVLDIIL